MKRALGYSLLLMMGVGCGPRYGRRVPSELVEKLTYESRIELLEAENELAVAIDRVDEAEAELLRTRTALRRAKDRRSAAEDEVGNAADDSSREVAQLAVEEARTGVDFLRARQGLNVKSEELEQLGLRCAHARFEQSRLAAARKSKVSGSEVLAPEVFADQVKACEAELAEQRKVLKDERTAVAAVKDTWEQHRAALAKKTFDARASPYVE